MAIRLSRKDQDEILYEREQLENELGRLQDELKNCGEYEYTSLLMEINRIKRQIYRLKNL